MPFYSNIPSDSLIIDDSNAHLYISDAAKIGEFGSGYVKRDFEARPFASYKPASKKTPYPRGEWAERIKDKEKRKEGLADLHRFLRVPILDQSEYPFCWFFGTTKCVMMNYARQGGKVPFLSATSGAAKTTGYVKRGGTATEALEGIDKYGISTVDFWPEHEMRRSLDTAEQRANADLHKVPFWEELPSHSFPDVITSLIDDDPTTLGLEWWGHLVAGLQARVLGNNVFGIEFANSWTKDWGKEGFGILSEEKASAFEQYALRSASPSGGL